MKKLIFIFIIMSVSLNFNQLLENNIRTFQSNALSAENTSCEFSKVDVEKENDIYAVRV